jgi:hypothetical protein
MRIQSSKVQNTVNTFSCSTLILFFALAAQIPVLAQSAPHSVRIPFVGCEADGQTGPIAAPRGQSIEMALPENAAQELAYYKAAPTPIGVLAPRGWHCFATYGSSGETLYVSPDSFRPDAPFSRNWKGFAGPAIQLSISDGGTSGRFAVARIIARVFPDFQGFVRRVIAEGIEPASEFPFSPYPNEMLIYRSNKLVEFKTPANGTGLGTNSALQKNGSPIEGAVMLFGEDPSVLQISMRLPPQFEQQSQTVIQEVERNVSRRKP